MRIDFETMFIPANPILETVLRGTIVYLSIVLFVRFLLKREAGQVGIADVLVIVLLADASQNAMANEYRSITEGLILVLTIIGWNYVLDWLCFRFPAFQRILHPPAMPLVRDGKMLRRNMRREMITEEELLTEVRKQNVSGLSDVKAAYMEGDGSISVVPRE